LITSSATFLLGLASTAIMGIGGYMIIDNTLTIGEFLAFTLYLGFMIAPIVQMSNIGSQLTEAFAGLDRTEELMNIPLEDDGSEREIIMHNIKGDVVFDQVSFAYEEGKEVVKKH
jgi:ABC-type bacteriocin/lantibiotic exporter with double-glycine peptidase domain